MKTKKKSGKNLMKSGKSQGKIREFDGIKKVGTLRKYRDICCLCNISETTCYTTGTKHVETGVLKSSICTKC